MDDLPREIPYAICRTEGEEVFVDARDELAETQDDLVVDHVDSGSKDKNVSAQGGNFDRYGSNLPPITTSAKELRSMLYAQRLEFYSLKGNFERATLCNQLLRERLGALRLECEMGTDHLRMSCENANVQIDFEELSLLSKRSSDNSYMSSFLDPSNF